MSLVHVVIYCVLSVVRASPQPFQRPCGVGAIVPFYRKENRGTHSEDMADLGSEASGALNHLAELPPPMSSGF